MSSSPDADVHVPTLCLSPPGTLGDTRWYIDSHELPTSSGFHQCVPNVLVLPRGPTEDTV